MNYSKPATILARKCLLSPSQLELEALIALNMPINWFDEGHKNTTLIETVFRVVQDKTLFDKFWNSFCKDTGCDVWSHLPGTKRSYAGLTILSDRPEVLKSFLLKSPGTPSDWEELSEDPALLFWSLGQNFLGMLAKFNLPSSVSKKFQDYRNDHLWVRAQSLKELSGFNVSWDADKEKDWLIASLKGLVHANRADRCKNFWRIGVLLDGEGHWEKWSEKDWSDVWLAQPPSLFLDAWSEAKQGARLENKFNAFVKSYKPTSGSDNLSHIVAKELSCSVATRVWQACMSRFPVSLKVLSGFVDTLLLDPEQKIHAVTFKLLLDFLNSPTKINPETENFLASLPPPASAKDMTQKIKSSLGLGSHIESSPAFEAYCLISHIKSHKDVLPSDFLSDIGARQNKNTNSEFFTSLVGYAERLAAKSKNQKEQQFAAEAFWRAVFEIPSANQHYWLKKASDNPALSAALSFWNDDFSERLNKAAEKRKRTKEISTLLSRLSMNSAIAQVTDLEEKTEKTSRRKL